RTLLSFSFLSLDFITIAWIFSDINYLSLSTSLFFRISLRIWTTSCHKYGLPSSQDMRKAVFS
ncbi:MAG: hypothetical protein K2K31_01100, partial [Clostridia bacterium]|nr:hypothetical protein [Clostridia bacterium]